MYKCYLNPPDMIRELSKEFRMFQFIPSLTPGLIDCKVLTYDLAIGKSRRKKEHFMARAFFSFFKPLGESILETSGFFMPFQRTF